LAVSELHTDAERDSYLAFVKAQPLPLSVECKRWTKPRSDPQNNALWGVAYVAIRDGTGQDDLEQMHRDFCGDFFGWDEYEFMGRRRRRPRRTTTTNEEGRKEKVPTDVFAKFYEFIQRQGAEYGVYVPDPEPWKARRR